MKSASRPDLSYTPMSDAEKNYRYYCWERNLFLNPFNSLFPYFRLESQEATWDERFMMEDMIVLDELTEADKAIMADIGQSYCHARYLFYVYEMSSPPIYPKSRVMDPDSTLFRDESTELLIDCYLRLFTIFDKLAKTIKWTFGIQLENVPGKSFEMDATAINISKKIREEYPNNPYLMSFVSSFSELNPWADRDSYVLWPNIKRMNALRNNATHAALIVSVKIEEVDKINKNRQRNLDKDALFIYIRDFEIQVERLLHITRNAILDVQMAKCLNHKKGRFR